MSADIFTFTMSRQATETIAAMHDHVQSLGRYYGPQSAHHRKAADSLGHQLGMLFGRPWATGTTSVSRDGDLSLFVNTPGIVFGIIWHGVRRYCTTDGCKAQINDDGHAWVYMPEYPILDHEHEPSYPLDAPQPGDWSFHS